jgi:hypothetical protein
MLPARVSSALNACRIRFHPRSSKLRWRSSTPTFTDRTGGLDDQAVIEQAAAK